MSRGEDPSPARSRGPDPSGTMCGDMVLDRTWLLGVAESERVALGRTIQYMPPDGWENESPAPGWRNRDLLAHVASAEVAFAAILGEEAPSEVEEYAKSLPKGETFTTSGFTEWAIARRAEQGPVALALDWGKAADLLLSRASKITEEDWRDKAMSSLAGELKVGYLVQFRVWEWYMHGEDLRAGGQLPPRLEHPPVFASCDLAIRMIPFALEVAGLSFPGKSVQVDLTGVGEGTWHQGLQRGKRPDEGSKPDAYIRGQGYAFALVAGKRADVDVCLYDGLLNVGGDTDVAEQILRNLRVFQ